MIAMDEIDGSHIAGVETCAIFKRWRENLRQRRRRQGCLSDGRRPAQHATIMRVRGGCRIARPFAQRRTKSSRDRARGNTRTAINLVVIVPRRDGELHAERDQHQHDKPKAISRYFHLGPQPSPPLRVTLPYVTIVAAEAARMDQRNNERQRRNNPFSRAILLTWESGRFLE